MIIKNLGILRGSRTLSINPRDRDLFFWERDIAKKSHLWSKLNLGIDAAIWNWLCGAEVHASRNLMARFVWFNTCIGVLPSAIVPCSNCLSRRPKKIDPCLWTRFFQFFCRPTKSPHHFLL